MGFFFLSFAIEECFLRAEILFIRKEIHRERGEVEEKKLVLFSNSRKTANGGSLSGEDFFKVSKLCRKKCEVFFHALSSLLSKTDKLIG